MRESYIEKVLVESIKRVGGLALKWVSPGNAGVPDRIIVMPNGRIYFVEVKAPGEKPRPLQNLWIERLRALGHDVRVVDHVEQAKAFAKEVGACPHSRTSTYDHGHHTVCEDCGEEL